MLIDVLMKLVLKVTKIGGFLQKRKRLYEVKVGTPATATFWNLLIFLNFSGCGHTQR